MFISFILLIFSITVASVADLDNNYINELSSDVVILLIYRNSRLRKFRDSAGTFGDLKGEIDNAPEGLF